MNTNDNDIELQKAIKKKKLLKRIAKGLLIIGIIAFAIVIYLQLAIIFHWRLFK